MHEKTALVWLLLTPSRDVEGAWVAHCLNLDVISQGTSLEHAAQMGCEAIVCAVDDDVSQGLDPFDRKPAPEECWQPLYELFKTGVPLESVPSEETSDLAAVAVQVLIVHPDHGAIRSEASPPAWQLAARERPRDQVSC